MLGIANKFINFLAIPSSLSRSYSTFPLCSWTTLIEIAVYSGSEQCFSHNLIDCSAPDIHGQNQNGFPFRSRYVSINSMGAPPPPPPGRLSGFCHFGGKNVANAPLWGANNATKSPPLGTYIDANAPPLGDKI
jgi:hypothetical protein